MKIKRPTKRVKEQFDPKDFAGAPVSFAYAVRTSEKNKKRVEDTMKEKQKEVDELVKENERDAHKVPKTKDLKKMHLSESLFEEYVDEITEESATKERTKLTFSKSDSLFDEIHNRLTTDGSFKYNREGGRRTPIRTKGLGYNRIGTDDQNQKPGYDSIKVTVYDVNNLVPVKELGKLYEPYGVITQENTPQRYTVGKSDYSVTLFIPKKAKSIGLDTSNLPTVNPEKEKRDVGLDFDEFLSTYQPTGKAKRVFDRIVKADRLFDLKRFLRQSYPRGRGLTHEELDAILEYETETVYDALYMDDSVNESIKSAKNKKNMQENVVDNVVNKLQDATKKLATVNEGADDISIKVRDFYMNDYADDDLGLDINPDITFQDVYQALKDGENIYEVIGVGDSLIRERIFDKLAKITGKDYDDIYTVWLYGGKHGKNRPTKNTDNIGESLKEYIDDEEDEEQTQFALVAYEEGYAEIADNDDAWEEVEALNDMDDEDAEDSGIVGWVVITKTPEGKYVIEELKKYGGPFEKLEDVVSYTNLPNAEEIANKAITDYLDEVNGSLKEELYVVWKENGKILGAEESNYKKRNDRITNARAYMDYTKNGFSTPEEVKEYFAKYYPDTEVKIIGEGIIGDAVGNVVGDAVSGAISSFTGGLL